jgi:NTF2 fold immunity protein
MARLISMMLPIVIGIATTAGLAISQSTPSYVPPDGFVPDAATAVRIAEAVWIPIYGAQQIAKEKPFKATLKVDVWTVTGKDLPAGTVGGVAEAEVSKRDGRILRVTHGQ